MLTIQKKWDVALYPDKFKYKYVSATFTNKEMCAEPWDILKALWQDCAGQTMSSWQT